MNNIKHIWSILCSSTSIDQNTNNVSIFNVIEQIGLFSNSSKEFDDNLEKIVPINMEIISLWKKEGQQSDFEQRVELIDPASKVMGTTVTSIKFPSRVQRFRADLKIQGLKITQPGEYHFRISIKEKSDKEYSKVHELPLLIEIKEAKINNT